MIEAAQNELMKKEAKSGSNAAGRDTAAPNASAVTNRALSAGIACRGERPSSRAFAGRTAQDLEPRSPLGRLNIL